MSDLYARIPTSARKTVPTARGFKSTGIEAEVCSWDGKIVSNIYWQDDDQKFHYSVWMEPHEGKGDSLLLVTGVVGDKDSARAPFTFECGKAVNY
jgi:hypothetical protein